MTSKGSSGCWIRKRISVARRSPNPIVGTSAVVRLSESGFSIFFKTGDCDILRDPKSALFQKLE